MSIPLQPGRSHGNNGVISLIIIITTTTTTILRPLFQDNLGKPAPERQNQSGFYWSKRQWVAVASAGPYASLHLPYPGLPKWAICKSAPCPRQITTPAPHHSILCRPDVLPAAQPTASKHWRQPAADIMFKNWQLNRNLNCQATAAAAAERGQQ